MELDELIELIRELYNLIFDADIAAYAGDVDEAREQLIRAKELLDVSFLA